MKQKKKLTIKEIGAKNLLLLLGAGILLLLLSFPQLFQGEEDEGEKQTDGTLTNAVALQAEQKEAEYLEERLTGILKRMRGIGEVEVMITLAVSGERVVLKDTPYESETVTEMDSAGGSRTTSQASSEETTIMITEENGVQTPYITKEIEAKVAGVVVVAQGAGTGAVSAEIVEAVSVLFDLPAHKVKVLPME